MKASVSGRRKLAFRRHLHDSGRFERAGQHEIKIALNWCRQLRQRRPVAFGLRRCLAERRDPVAECGDVALRLQLEAKKDDRQCDQHGRKAEAQTFHDTHLDILFIVNAPALRTLADPLLKPYMRVRLTVAYIYVHLLSSSREACDLAEDGSDRRRAEIAAAAFETLAEKGYRSTSMLQIAKRAKASNQTLYAWYGNKQTLFQSIIVENSKAVRELLNSALERHDDPLETLEALGPLLLSFTTDDKAIIINRAAIIDATETGLLAEAIEQTARDVIYPLICALMERLAATGRFVLDNGPVDAADALYRIAFR